MPVTTQHHTFEILLERDDLDDAWVTYVPALNNLSTYGETRDDAITRTREAITGYLRIASKKGLSLPRPEPARPSNEQELVTIHVHFTAA